MRCLKIAALAMMLVLTVASRLAAEEPQITSVFPLGGKQGTSLEVELRGHDLEGPYGVWFDCDALHGDIGSVVEANADQKSQTTEGMVEKAQHLVMKVTIDPSAKIGAHAFRLVSGSGISNAMWLEVNAETTLLKNQLTPKTAEEFQLSRIPAVVNGRISQKGETDRYVFNAEKGERLRFEVLTGVRGWPTSPPSSPLLTLYEPTSSWLDPKRLVRLAINDESIFYVPQLTYRFEKSGRYIIEVGAVNGQGGPNYSYQLRIADAIPKTSEGTKWLPQALAHPDAPEWKERSFTRGVTGDRLELLRARTILRDTKDKKGERGSNQGSPFVLKEETASQGEIKTETPAMDVPALLALPEREPNDIREQAAEFSVPSIIEGVIERPGDVDYFKFKVNTPETLVFEIQTPDSPPLRFNPRLEVTDQAGAEVLTNIYREVGGSGDEWVKSIEPKTICRFERAGEYFLQVRDLTSRQGDPHFRYRVLVRPEIPHMGEVTVKGGDQINLIVGEAKKLSVSTGREEGFEGDIALTIDPLPQGVQAFTATEVPHGEGGRGANLVGGQIHQERFRSEVQKGTIILFASEDAPATKTPEWARLSARPILGSRPGAAHLIQKIPIMVSRPSRETADK